MFLIACEYRALKSFFAGDSMSERKQQYSEMTEAEKEAIFKICRKFIWFLEKARREGILAIEENLDSLHEEMGGINGIFMQKLLYLVVDGTDGNMILSSKWQYDSVAISHSHPLYWLDIRL